MHHHDMALNRHADGLEVVYPSPEAETAEEAESFDGGETVARFQVGVDAVGLAEGLALFHFTKVFSGSVIEGFRKEMLAPLSASL